MTWTLSIALALAAQQAPQVRAGRFDIQSPVGDHFGVAVAAAGDVDGDGVGDLIVGAPQPLSARAGYAAIHSGADGALLRRLDGRAAEDGYGFAVAGGADLDGDGRADQAIAALNWRRSPTGAGAYVELRSGADGALIRELAPPPGAELYGHALLLLGDCDGDGRAELVVAAPGSDSTAESAPGQVFVHDGATGELRYTLRGEHREQLFGLSLAATGDLDGDGAPDFAIAAPGHGQREGLVRVVSGRTGETLFELRGAQRDESFGATLSAHADLDGDGLRDLVVGSYGLAHRTPGAVRAVSSATRAPLLVVTEEPGVFHPGRVLALCADFNGDGAPELLCADPSAPGLALRLYALGGEHEELPDPLVRRQGGWQLALLGDLDGDGAEDLAVGSPWARIDAAPESAGAVLVLSGRTRAVLFTLRGS